VPDPPTLPRFHVRRELCDLFSVKPRTISRWRRAGLIPSVRVGRGWLYPASPTEEVVARRAAQTTRDQEIFARVRPSLP
jgi:predicted site-specific integrase-resolvase